MVKQSENTSTNSPSKSGVDNKRKLDSGGLDIDVSNNMNFVLPCMIVRYILYCISFVSYY